MPSAQEYEPHQGAIVLYQVCWKSMVGHTAGRGRPMPRQVADFMARDEALANPLHRYWVEECRPEDRRLS